jgi:hypothetical protein
MQTRLLANLKKLPFITQEIVSKLKPHARRHNEEDVPYFKSEHVNNDKPFGTDDRGQTSQNINHYTKQLKAIREREIEREIRDGDAYNIKEMNEEARKQKTAKKQEDAERKAILKSRAKEAKSKQKAADKQEASDEQKANRKAKQEAKAYAAALASRGSAEWIALLERANKAKELYKHMDPKEGKVLFDKAFSVPELHALDKYFEAQTLIKRGLEIAEKRKRREQRLQKMQAEEDAYIIMRRKEMAAEMAQKKHANREEIRRKLLKAHRKHKRNTDPAMDALSKEFGALNTKLDS